MLRKIGRNYQVALPRALVSMLGLKLEDYLDIHIERGKIVMEPQVLVPKDQAYFFTKEWQKEEKKAAKDIEKKRVTKTKNLKGLFKKLDR